ncbi:hypothetical protein TNCT_180171 [Trichonephila clavata]|uniref:Uncharacterized protein n=1 Tax=Trichonephila clavata TaxID=2740835 RepID=A0A8X6L1M5_TRICU|nr:hypothetical protein TNCT_180171 [Trichonephila clavata]
MGQKLKDLSIEICPDKVHLCPVTAHAARMKTENMTAVPRLLLLRTPKVNAVITLDSCGLAALPVFQNVTEKRTYGW